ncbi:P-loop containing nucleoside triphosphate hydrolases superfamily protein [Rhynchospora pubera]|uniref:P-loop containing nucleoside triphosphate hydrolases superfamily protein n=1 Tax=Rhynchospora pubera TaxID=906938 RepID=A0AAV8BWH6_9POAL|nr:P-loop containing nucleoside triphosphate hydrolases superfamily protein [Rhynchospora pubera]
MEDDWELASINDASATEDDWELSSNNDAITLVLVGEIGEEKSATGNSILGRKAFKSTLTLDNSKRRPYCQCIVDWSDGSDEGGKEIAKCLDLAKDGIHAVILVFSVKSRFSEGEETMLERLQMLFGKRIVEYMILVFTGGDELEEDGETFQEYLSRIIIEMCENRVVLFNNEAKNENVKDDQVQKLLFYVDQVMANTGGKSFSDEIFRELKQGAIKLHGNEKDIDNLNGVLAEQIAVEQKLNSTIERLEKELINEQAARLKAQKIADKKHVLNEARLEFKEFSEKARKEAEESKAAQLKALKIAEEARLACLESCKLKESLEKAQKEAEESKTAQLKARKIAEEARLEFRECSEKARKEAEESKDAQLKTRKIAEEARLACLESCKLKESLEKAQKEAEESKSAQLKARKIAEEARLESSKFKECSENARKEAEESKAAELKAQKIAVEARLESCKLKRSLEKAQKDAKESKSALLKAQIFADEARLESCKFKESLEKVQKEAKELKVARFNAKRIAKEACIETCKLKESLEMAQKKAKELMDAQMKATKYIRG